MTENEIRKYIYRLNNGKPEESIFTRKISKNVVFAKVWPELPKVNDNISSGKSSYSFFFIKFLNKGKLGLYILTN